MWTVAPVDCSFYAYFHMYSFINHHSYRRPHISYVPSVISVSYRCLMPTIVEVTTTGNQHKMSSPLVQQSIFDVSCMVPGNLQAGMIKICESN